ERPLIEIPVPERPGVHLLISPNITNPQLKAWRRNAGEGTKKDGPDSLAFAAYVVAGTTKGILLNGEIAQDPDGNDVTFASPEVWKAVGAVRPVPEGVRAFFGVDPHVESAAMAILEASGFGEDIE